MVSASRVSPRQDALGGLQEMAADLAAPHPRVVAHDLVGEGGHLAEQLHSDQAAAHHHEAEQAALALGIELDVGALEALDHVVAQQHGVGQGLEGEGRRRARDQLEIGVRAEGQDELIVGQLDAGAFRRRRQDDAAFEVDLPHGRLDEARPAQEVAHRQRAMPQLERAREGLEKQRRHQEEVVAADQHHLEIGPPRAAPLEMAGRPDAAKPAAEHDDARQRPSLGPAASWS